MSSGGRPGIEPSVLPLYERPSTTLDQTDAWRQSGRDVGTAAWPTNPAGTGQFGKQPMSRRQVLARATPLSGSRASNPARGPSDGRGRFADVLLPAFSDGGPGGTRARSGGRPPLPLGPASEAGFLGPLVAVVRIALTFRAYETRTGAAAVTASGAPSGAPACAYAQRRVLGRRGASFLLIALL